jgi:hypothetical protein
MNKKVIWLMWLALVIGWNFRYPTALPYEDVFVTVCLSFLIKYVERGFGK